MSSFRYYNKKWKKKQRKRNTRKWSYQYGLDRWSPWVASENVSSIKRRENNTFIKIFKHAGSFVTILFARIMHLSMQCRRGWRQGIGWGFDFFQKFAIKFPAHGQIIPVKCNQICPPQNAHCCQSQGRT